MTAKIYIFFLASLLSPLRYLTAYWTPNKHIKRNLAQTESSISPSCFFMLPVSIPWSFILSLELETLEFSCSFFHNMYPEFKQILLFPSEYILNLCQFMTPPSLVQEMIVSHGDCSQMLMGLRFSCCSSVFPTTGRVHSDGFHLPSFVRDKIQSPSPCHQRPPWLGLPLHLHLLAHSPCPLYCSHNGLLALSWTYQALGFNNDPFSPLLCLENLCSPFPCGSYLPVDHNLLGDPPGVQDFHPVHCFHVPVWNRFRGGVSCIPMHFFPIILYLLLLCV